MFHIILYYRNLGYNENATILRRTANEENIIDEKRIIVYIGLTLY